jgi:hypothetical protein
MTTTRVTAARSKNTCSSFKLSCHAVRCLRLRLFPIASQQLTRASGLCLSNEDSWGRSLSRKFSNGNLQAFSLHNGEDSFHLQSHLDKVGMRTVSHHEDLHDWFGRVRLHRARNSRVRVQPRITSRTARRDRPSFYHEGRGSVRCMRVLRARLKARLPLQVRIHEPGISGTPIQRRPITNQPLVPERIDEASLAMCPQGT